MRGILLALALLPALRDGATLRPAFRKFDRVVVSCTVKTEITASNGKNSKYELKINFSSEVEKAEGQKAIFDCGVSYLKITGTLRGKPVDYEWSRSGREEGRPVAALRGALKKGWKVTLDGAKGFSVDDAALALNDQVPLLNPGIFLGLSVPLPYGSVDLGSTWKVKGLKFGYFSGFGLDYSGSLLFVDEEKNLAKISGDLRFVKAEDEVPIAGAVNFRGRGSAMLEYDLKTGRPLRGATAIRAHVAQGGFKRDVRQVIEFEVR